MGKKAFFWILFEYTITIAFVIWIFRPRFFHSIGNVFWGKGTVWSLLLAVVLVWGVNFIFWGVIGIIRILSDKILPFFHNNKKSHGNVINKIKRKDVAVMVPAHNEELVIDDTLISLKKIIAPENIFVISDGSNDRTVEIAKKYTNNVLDINPGKGKAGALETGIKHFHIQKNFKALVLVDADTRLKKNYLRKALPSFNDENVVAVAGYASTIWNPKKMSWRQTLFVSHRDRVYFLGQRLVKFGQTWKYTNVTPIVPGFASIYRTSILDKIDINPKGLVIEDFNMTFEVHHKKLGIIAHHPSVIAYTQDPDNADDYFRQIRRWHLGFWQTIKFHGFWPGKFWIAMIPTLIEVTLGSLVFLLTPILLLLSLILPQIFPSTQWPFFLETQYLLVALFVGIWLSDYLLTVIVAIIQRRKEYLVVGLFFPVVRILDSIAFLSGIPRAFFVKSNGRWISPSRRTQ